jgi:peptide/nickel transport system substrate-binding protein
MTSADVVNSITYVRGAGSPTAVYFANVKSIGAPDRSTVVITLNHPDAGFKYSLSYEAPIFEKSFQDAHPTTMGNPGVLIQGTGPWKVDSFDPTSSMRLSANPNWWGGKVPVQHISYKFFSTETSEALAMRAGEIDVAFPQEGKTFAATSGAKVTSWLSPSVVFFAMSANAAPWRDVHVRRAVAYALNRTDLIAAHGGPTTAAPLSTIIPPSQLTTLGASSQVSKLLQSLPQYPYDVAKAKQEMALSPYPHGFTATSDTTSAIGNYPQIAQVISAELQKIGITLKVNVIPESKWLTELEGPDAIPDGNILGGLGAVSPDPSIFPSYMLGGAATYNAARYTSSSIDSLLAAGVATSAPAARLTIYGQILHAMANDLPYVALYQEDSYTALTSKFTMPPGYVYWAFLPWALQIKSNG